MTKYHIKKNGTPGICNAQEGNCPLGGVKQHYNSLEEANNAADLVNEKNILIENLSNAKNKFQQRRIERKIRELNSELNLPPYDGYTTEKEYNKQEQKKIDRENYLKSIAEKEEKENKESEEKAKEFSKLEKLEIPESILKLKSNYLYNDNYFNRVQMNDKGVYRGEKKEGSTDNTGTAKYGLGRYTTTDKKYASKFGNVREIHLDELPSRPLSFKDELAFQMFEQELAKEHGMKLKHMNQYNRVDEIIQKMGYNGLTIGPKNNMIIVSYWTPKDYDKVRGY